MSTNLGAPLMTGGQANPETTHNDGIGAMDAAMTEILVVDCTNDVSLTNVQYRSAFKFKLTPVGVGKSLTLPAIKRWIYLQNSGANPINVVRGTTTIALPAASSLFFFTDGTANGLEQVNVIGIQPHDFHIFQPGAPAAGATLVRFKATRAFTLLASLAGSYFSAITAATASTTFTFKKNGTSIGTVNFAAAATVGTVTFVADVSFAAGDIFLIEAPSPADATLADISFDIFGRQ